MKKIDKTLQWKFDTIRAMLKFHSGFDLPDIKVKHCAEADREHQKIYRNFAHMDHYPLTICYAKALLDMPDVVQYGILAHEIGHIIQEIKELPYDEMAADMLIKNFANINIEYIDTIQHAYF